MNSDKDDGYVLYRRHHSGPHGIRLEGDPGTTTPIVRTPHCPPARTYYLNASRSPAALGGVYVDPQWMAPLIIFYILHMPVTICMYISDHD